MSDPTPRSAECCSPEILQTRQFMEAAIDSLPEQITILNTSGDLVYVNQTWKEFGDRNGLAATDYCIGENYIHVCRKAKGEWSDGAREAADGIEQVLAGHAGSFSMDYPCHAPFKQRWFRLNVKGFPINGEQWVVVAHENITELKMTALSFIQNETKLRGILASIPDAMCMLDRENTIVWANDRARELFGPSLEKKFCRAAFKREDDARLCNDCVVQRTFQDGHVHTGEYTHRTFDGTERTFLCRTAAIGFDKAGIPTHVMEIMQDVTEQRATEKQIRRLSQAVEHSPVSVVITDVKGTIEYVNPKFTEVTGYSPDEALGQNPRILNAHKQPKEYYEGMWKTLLAKKTWQGEFANRKKNGEIYWESASISPVLDDHGNPSFYVAVKEDITDRKAMIEELEAAKEKAESATRAKSDFLATMSHEIRTPMNAILGMSHLVLESGLAPIQRHYVTNIQSAADALLSIINDILDLSKVEAGKLEMESQEFQFGAVIEKIINVLKFTADDKGLNLIYRFNHPVPLFLIGDTVRVGQVIINLVSNALKYTEKGDVVIISSIEEEFEDRIYLKLSVEDTGIGMSEEQIDMLFQPFTQVDSSTTRRYGGTGLGLVIVKRMVETMGGDIRVASRPNVGSVFTVVIPFRRSSSTRVPTIPLEHLAGKRVLVIEDHDAEGKALKNNLTELGMDVVVSASGRQGLACLGDGGNDLQVDLVVICREELDPDIRMMVDRLSGSRESGQPACLVVLPFNRDEQSASRLRQFLQKKNIRNICLEKPLTPLVLVRTLSALVAKEPGWVMRPSNGREETLSVDFPGNPEEKRVLVVDDDLVNREIVLAFLNKTGVQLAEAGDGKTAREMVAESSFDLVLMDVEMPVMDGFEATRQIRRLDVPWASTIPIVALTGHAMADFRERCLASGMNDYLVKPVKPSQLQETVRSWIWQDIPKPDQSLGILRESKSDLKWIEQYIRTRACQTYASGNVQVYVKMLRMFNTSYRNTGNELQRAWQDRNLEEMARLMHKIKSVAGMVGAAGLARMAKDLERDAKAAVDSEKSFSEPERRRFETGISGFSVELGHVVAASEELVRILDNGKKETETRAVPAESMSRSRQQRILNRLIGFVQSHQPTECRKALNELKSGVSGADWHRALEESQRLISRYRFSEAEAVLHSIGEKETLL